ncbi:MAG: DUF1674 domain-containing protein, partial [Burkholderiaceae bacterium]
SALIEMGTLLSQDKPVRDVGVWHTARAQRSSIRVPSRCKTMDEKSTDLPAPETVPVAEVLPVQPPGQPATPHADGVDPTRYGDWEKNGRCIDF